jgi:hypothetical protein
VSDWVRDAFLVDVVDGDFFGTGKLASKGKLLVLHDWDICKTVGPRLDDSNPYDLSSALSSA